MKVLQNFRLWGWVGLSLAIAVGSLVAVLVGNAWRVQSRQIQIGPVEPVKIDIDSASRRLSQLLRIPTVSYQNASTIDASAFDQLRRYLVESYPEVHRQLAREEISANLLYRWPGTDPTLTPALLMAHMDVVPAEASESWAHPPFSGEISEGFIWGRGALDMKGSMAAILEAAEHLLRQGYKPRRTIYFAFGHDEEVGGLAGNRIIAEKLKAQGVKLHSVLDEGSIVAVGLLPSVSKPVALIGIAEKGYLTLELSVDGEGGHSSYFPLLVPMELLQT